MTTNTRAILRHTIFLFVTAVVASPIVFAQSTTTTAPETVQYSGTFVKKKAKTRGAFTIVQRGEKLILILDDEFSTKKAPDLKIYLSHMPVEMVDSKNALKNGAVYLADLESKKGRQEYELPDDLDLSTIKTILIHCLKYDKLFGAASVTTL
ncbi:MAG: hypothetical protein BMS9Abin05_1991 [Rhodothermia bacterium]|nr:MAG: hypothetical protein BMS9Abin05_1991 [Rhodothermia bacterium]